MKLIRRLPAVVFAAFAFGSAAHAQVVTPQPAPTIITTAPYTISAPGYYQLGADLTITAASGVIITINSGNVTLDFAGHYISGPNNNPASQVTGVYASERGNLNIRNGTVAFCNTGIYLDGNTSSTSLNINQRVDNMLVTYCYATGIYLYYARNSVVSNCRVSSVGGSTINTFAYGIRGLGTGINVVNNVITTVTSTSGNAFGIDVASYVANNTISNITSNNGGSGFGIYNVRFAVGNTIDTATTGISGAVKYKDNLTYNCTTPFAGGTSIGTNN